jgi:TRAP-type mannitol/chloroaromatic compound transport system permease small subunit
MGPLLHLADKLDALVRGVGQVAAWLNLALVGVILAQVVLRYWFHHGLVPLEELMWHLYGTAFMFGLSYALVSDAHIRVDLLHDRLPRRVKAAVEVLGIALLLLPLVVVLVHHSLDWVALSYRLNESSENPGGLPYRWAIKAVIPMAMTLLGLAALARLLRELRILLHREGG